MKADCKAVCIRDGFIACICAGCKTFGFTDAQPQMPNYNLNCQWCLLLKVQPAA